MLRRINGLVQRWIVQFIKEEEEEKQNNEVILSRI
jgi:hypothetical protein